MNPGIARSPLQIDDFGRRLDLSRDLRVGADGNDFSAGDRDGLRLRRAPRSSVTIFPLRSTRSAQSINKTGIIIRPTRGRACAILLRAAPDRRRFRFENDPACRRICRHHSGFVLCSEADRTVDRRFRASGAETRWYRREGETRPDLRGCRGISRAPRDSRRAARGRFARCAAARRCAITLASSAMCAGIFPNMIVEAPHRSASSGSARIQPQRSPLRP